MLVSAPHRAVQTASEVGWGKLNLESDFWKVFQFCSGPNTWHPNSTGVWAIILEHMAGEGSITTVRFWFYLKNFPFISLIAPFELSSFLWNLFYFSFSLTFMMECSHHNSAIFLYPTKSVFFLFFILTSMFRFLFLGFIKAALHESMIQNNLVYLMLGLGAPTHHPPSSI